MKIEVASAVICKNNSKYLIARRTEPKRLEGLWEFPGGTMEEGESIYQTLNREIYEELGIEVDIIEDLETYNEIDGDLNLTIHFIKCNINEEYDEESIELSEHSEWTWIDEDNYKDFDYTTLTKSMLADLF